MEFSLLRGEQGYFGNITDGTEDTKLLTFRNHPVKLEFDNKPHPSATTKEDKGENLFKSELTKLLCGPNSEGQSNNALKCISLDVFVTMTASNIGYVKIVTRLTDEMTIDGMMDIPVFEPLVNSSLCSKTFGFNVKLTLLLVGENGSNQYEIAADDLKIIKLNEPNFEYGLQFRTEYLEDIWSQWSDHGTNCEVKITLILVLDSSAVQTLLMKRLKNDELTKWSRKMLDDGFGSDMVIQVVSDEKKGKIIKCHKFILIDSSPVLKSALTTENQDFQDNCLTIKDLTEDGVMALLSYMYCSDLTKAVACSKTALELLKAGYTYEMRNLLELMFEVFCSMPCNWVSVDSAVDLLLYSNALELQKAEKRSLEILKWYAQKPGSLVESAEYRKMFLQYPDIAMAITELFLNF